MRGIRYSDLYKEKVNPTDKKTTYAVGLFFSCLLGMDITNSHTFSYTLVEYGTEILWKSDVLMKKI